MIGLVLVTHADLARELIAAAEMIVGPMEQAEAVGLGPDDSAETIREAIAGAIGRVSSGGVIILTNMFGGTPSNMSLSFLEEGRVEVVSGVNLPMLIRFASERTGSDVATLARGLRETGREGIAVAGDYLK